MSCLDKVTVATGIAPELPAETMRFIRIPLYRIERDDGSTRYRRTLSPDDPTDVIAFERLDERLITEYEWAASRIDYHDEIDWPLPWQRELAISAVMHGTCVWHAIATARREPCQCVDCVRISESKLEAAQ